MESAGLPKHSVVGKDVGVFIGGAFSDVSDILPVDEARKCLLQLLLGLVSATASFAALYCAFTSISCPI
jgi:acyl transferase domain-containing protein